MTKKSNEQNLTMQDLMDNSEMIKVMEILEELEERDEKLAIALLKEFNDKSKKLGKLLMNLDPDLSHEEWKGECDKAKKEVDDVVKRIEEA